MTDDVGAPAVAADAVGTSTRRAGRESVWVAAGTGLSRLTCWKNWNMPSSAVPAFIVS